MRRRQTMAGLAAVALVVAACGTTVHGSRLATANTADGGLSADTTVTGSGNGPSSTLGLGGSSGPSATDTVPGDTAAPGQDTGAPDSSSLPAVAATPHGAPISIGIATFSGTEAVGAAGFEGAPKFIGEQVYQPIIDYYNKHGGFGGHQVRTVYYQFPLVAGTPYAQEEQQACAKFTQDNHVVAVLSDRSSFDGVLTACLAKANVPFITDIIGYQNDADLAHDPLYFPSMVGGQRAIRNWIPGLQRLGYFSPGAKVGLLTCDQATFRADAPTVASALAAIGVKLLETEAISCGNDGAIASQSLAATLKFKALGVDHLLIMDEGPVLTLLFPISAETQAYRPRYGLNTFNAGSFAARNLPTQQLHGAIGIGWWPWQDVDPSSWPAPNAATSLCLSTLAAAGIDVASSSGRSASTWPCGMVVFLHTVLGAAQGTSASAFRNAVDGLGTSWVSPTTFTTQFGPSRHDGASSYRDFGYVDNCRCFKYLSNATHPMQP